MAISRRAFLHTSAAGVAAAAYASALPATEQRPNILYLMMDQMRFDAIASLGNPHIYTPNLDRLAARGVAFTNAYSTCPVCVPARYTIRTGREPHTTAIYENGPQRPVEGQAPGMEERCGAYLPRTMQGLGYRTFGIGKFHTNPWDEELGYDTHLHSEELYGSPDQRARDSYSAFINEKHPEYAYVEGLMGERTDMYYMPQRSAQPASCTVEGWAADQTVQLIQQQDDRPYFGFVSFIGPHPPFAPPIPFNRMYNPDTMPDPVIGNPEINHLDEQIPWMNYAIWADDINASHARVLKARYYGEITYIDYCIGRILDAVEARPDAANTLICFFADHGDHLGDHNAWQKESFFEASCHIPYLVSWPAAFAGGQRRNDLVCLTDLFGIATSAAGAPELRDGVDVLGTIANTVPPRERLIGLYGEPGGVKFKIMVREGDWKYIYLANGGREQLFNLAENPEETVLYNASARERLEQLRVTAIAALDRLNANRALENGTLRAFPYTPLKRFRIQQFDGSRGVRGYPEHPADVLKDWPGW